MPTRLELESSICDVEKKLKEAEVILKQKELALKYAHEDLEEKRVEWQMHDKNMRFMKGKATLVDFKEFVGVQKLLKTAKEDFDGISAKVWGLSKTVAIYNKEVEGMKKEIADSKATLVGCDIVIPFPVKE